MIWPILAGLSAYALIVYARKRREAIASAFVDVAKYRKEQKMPEATSANVYISDPDKVIMHPAGVQEYNGVRYMRRPLWDPEAGIYARITYRQQKDVLARLGARRITEQEWMALYNAPSEEVVVLKPCTLVNTGADQYRMRSLDYCRKHDACVAAQVTDDDARIAVNLGKQRLDVKNGRPPKAGYQINYGWIVNGKPIQSPGEAHEDTYTDYSELTQGAML